MAFGGIKSTLTGAHKKIVGHAKKKLKLAKKVAKKKRRLVKSAAKKTYSAKTAMASKVADPRSRLNLAKRKRGLSKGLGRTVASLASGGRAFGTASRAQRATAPGRGRRSSFSGLNRAADSRARIARVGSRRGRVTRRRGY